MAPDSDATPDRGRAELRGRPTPLIVDRRWRRRLGGSALLVAAFAGLTALLDLASVRAFAGDSDGATVVLEGHAMAAGHITLHGWALSVDSFWSVDAVVYTLAELVTGVRAELVHLGPALIAALVVVVGAIVARDGRRGAPALAGVVTVVALVALPSRFLSFFYLRGPLHVGTTLWCLLAFWALRRRRFGPGWVAGVALLAAAVLGDLQAVGLGLAPVLVAGIVAMRRLRRWRAGAPLVGAAVASVALAVCVRVLAEAIGTFAIGKVQPRASTAQMGRNVRHLLSGGAHLFGAGTSPLGAAGVPVGLRDVRLVGLIVVLGAVALAGVRLLRALVQARPQHIFPSVRGDPVTDAWVLDDLILFGFLGGLAVFVALSVADAFEFDRYLTASVVYGAVLAGRLVAQGAARLDSVVVRRALAAVGLALATAFAAGFGMSLTSASPVGDDSAVAGFLQAHHLDRGIGDYNDASIITVATDGVVTVRPVTGDPASRVVRYQRQSDASWYAGQTFQFVLYDTAKPGSFNAGTAALTFGSPARVYAVGTYRVLVYARPVSVSTAGYDPG